MVKELSQPGNSRQKPVIAQSRSDAQEKIQEDEEESEAL
jgi:hypothetical protein